MAAPHFGQRSLSGFSKACSSTGHYLARSLLRQRQAVHQTLGHSIVTQLRPLVSGVVFERAAQQLEVVFVKVEGHAASISMCSFGSGISSPSARMASKWERIAA